MNNKETNKERFPSTAKLLKQIAKESESVKKNDRRDFLKKGFMFSAGAAAGSTFFTTKANALDLPPKVPAVSKRLGKGVVDTPYGMPSKFESHVARRTQSWLTPDSIASISMCPIQEMKGIITPSGLHFERYHAGIAQVNPDEYRLMIHGMVKKPILLTLDDIMRYPSVSRINFLECPANGGMEWRGPQMKPLQFTHGMMSCSQWTGVYLKTILADLGVSPKGKWVLAEGGDGSACSRSIPMEKIMDDAIVAYGQNGEMLRPEQGYPVRLFLPGWEGNTSIKWLRRLEVGDKPWHHREETSKYTDLLKDGISTRFSWVQEANSVITSPCPEHPWKGIKKGYVEIEGLAWSGRGKIKLVDISLDGGVNWKKAKLKGMVLPKAWTRFSYLHKWDGKPLLLQSRAIDETGYVQPTLKQLRDARGVESIYHKNSIHTWKVYQDGKVENVQFV